ncbi:MAG TPA: CDP-glycerol glycerophosphotransferase family protein [Candidatus Saccharimonadales bacterium]|nr:CDP-glycerol glycerophosphotransferase family protein [Candidatus Saccharimonadales bacterium]
MLSLILLFMKLAARAVYFCFKLLPTDNKVVLISRKNRTTSIDFRLLVERLAIDQPSTRAVVLNHPLGNPLTALRRFIVEMYHLATARAVIIDSYVPAVSILNHKPGLVVVQIWHALGAIKKFGRQILDLPEGSSSRLANAMDMHRNYSYVTVGSSLTAPTYAAAFGIDESRIKPVGLPRVDYLVNKANQAADRARVLAAFPELTDKQVILYAPTFRKTEQINPAKIAEALGDDYKLLVSQHRLDKAEIQASDRLVVNDRFDVLELLAAADAVVTDYSAVVFEAALSSKPLYFYAYDLRQYESDRGLAMDYRQTMPGAINESVDGLVAAIKARAYSPDRIKDFASKYVSVRDGSCSERIIKLLELDRK